MAATKPGPEDDFTKREAIPCTLEESGTLSCEMTGTLAPYDEIEMRIAVNVKAGR